MYLFMPIIQQMENQELSIHLKLSHTAEITPNLTSNSTYQQEV